MAATQAESQLNDTNREHLHDKSSSESSALQQNGNEKNGARSVNVVADQSSKNKYPPHNYNADMSHFRPEPNIGGGGGAQPVQHEQGDEMSSKHTSEKAYMPSIDNGGKDVNYGTKGLPESASIGPNVQNYNSEFSPRNNYPHPEHNPNAMQMNSGGGDNNTGTNCNNSNSVHQNSIGSQFGNMRHPFPNSKPMPGGVRPGGPHMNAQAANYNPHSPQRFMSSQAMSQQIGTTPTLNQLLQSSNPVHRYQNSNYEYSNQKPNEAPHGAPFNHGWNTRPMAPYVNQPGVYRNPMPELPSQNSNDSSSGGGPQAMRPTPSPTGSTGSRSMSPAIGQQNIPMPPRPSSGQSDSGSTSSQSRLSHSPMNPNQGGYQQQPLAPPPHMQNYKMGSGGAQGPLHPGNMIPHPSAGAPYSQMPPSHQPFNQQGAYAGRGVQNVQPYHQNYGMQQSGTYPNRPIPNHVQHGQFSGFQGWPSPNVSVSNSSSSPMPMSGPGVLPSPVNHVPPQGPGKGVPPPASSPQQPPASQPSPGPPHQQMPANQLHPMHHMHSAHQQSPQQPQQQPSPSPSQQQQQQQQPHQQMPSNQLHPMHPMHPPHQQTQQQPQQQPSPVPSQQQQQQQQQQPHQQMPSNQLHPMHPMHPPHQQTQQQPQQQPSPVPSPQSPHQPPQQMPANQMHPMHPMHPPHQQAQQQQPQQQPSPVPSPQSPHQPPQQMPANQMHPMHHIHQQHQQTQQQQQQQPSPAQSPQSPQCQPPQQMPSNQMHPMHHMQPPHQQTPPLPQRQPSPVQSQQQQQQSPQCQPPQSSPQMAPNCSPGSRSHTPPQYLKHHLQQHKVGFNNTSSNMPPSPGPPPGMYGGSSSPGMGPPPHHLMGPPIPGGHHHMGAGGMNHPMSNLMPPHGNSHHDSPMPPPSSTPNSHTLPTSIQSESAMEGGMHESGGMNSTASGNMTNVSQIHSGTVTSVVTTGPDGAPMDEASQQSTLSNTSAASGEDPSSTPKRKESSMGMMGPMSGYLGHGQSQSPLPPCSPNMNSVHDDYSSESNQGWSRTPSSPVFNSHMPSEMYRSKKSDSLGKLYEMDDCPDRRIWLDKLLRFMEDRGTPIPQCPAISKNPLDLFRLYVYVKERGGFLEVCKVAKNKIWKDIAGLLGIGASSSAAYTLRKHYTKHLLPFECHFDRGGIDPQPIINQVETTSKKKNAKAASVPSPGSSNSQDSFSSGQTTSGPSMDGYGYGYGNTGAAGPAAGDYGNQRGPPTMPNNQDWANDSGNRNQYPRGPYAGSQGNIPASPVQPWSQMQRPPVSNAQPPPNAQWDRYSPNPSPQQPPQQQQQPPFHSQPGHWNVSAPKMMNQVDPPNKKENVKAPPAPSPSSSNSQDSFPPGQAVSGPNMDGYGGYGYGGASAGAATIDYGGPRGPPSIPNNQGWPNDNANRNQYPRGPYAAGSQGNVPAGPVQPPWSQTNVPPSPVQPPWSQTQVQRPPVPSAQPPPPNAQWERYSTNATPQQQQQQQQQPQPPFPPPQGGQWNMSANAMAQNASMRSMRPSYRNEKPFPLMPPAQPVVKSVVPNQLPPQPTFVSAPTMKRELVFPADSVEAVTPLLYKRKRLTKSDVAPVDPWKLMMCLRSGLLTETCWALDVLNILLFDEVSVQYFSLSHLPGLLDILLEHFVRSLDDMLESSHENGARKWYEKPTHATCEPDLGRVIEPINAKDRLPFRSNLPDYTMKSRRGKSVATVDGSDDLFVRDGPREWESRDMQIEDVVEPDPRYIVPCFRSEFGIVPFVRLMPEAKNYVKKRRPGTNSDSDTNHRTKDSPAVVVKCESDMEPASQTSAAGTDLSANAGPTAAVVVVKTEPLDNHVDDAKSLPATATVKSESGDARADVKSEPESRTRRRRITPEQKKDDKDDAPKENGNEPQPQPRSDDESNDAEDVDKKDMGNAETIDVLKKRKLSLYEDECYTRDEASLYLVTDTQDAIARRCICISTILRNLTFIPGNEHEFSKNPSYLALMGKLLLIHHEHPLRTQKQQNYDREDDTDFSDCCSSLQGESEWWWDFLHQIRENVLVSIANISGYIDLSNYLEDVSRPILDGLLHWAVCPAAQGQDPFPTASTLSPQKLALEALCKLCVTDANVDLVIATPPYSRLEKLCSVLTKLLCKSEEQVLREFAINLLHYLAAADTSMSRIIALQSPCISLLVAFIEQAEQSALSVANQHGISALRDNPESMGTSLDMLRRAARTLLHLSKHPDNKPLFLQQEQRLLALVMSQILDQQVAGIISQVLYQCSRTTSPAPAKS